MDALLNSNELFGRMYSPTSLAHFLAYEYCVFIPVNQMVNDELINL